MKVRDARRTRRHAVGGRGRLTRDAPERPDAHRSDPGEVADDVHDREEKRRRIAKAPARAYARDGTFGHKRACRGRRDPPEASSVHTGNCQQACRSRARQRKGRDDRMRHHQRGRDAIARHAAWVPLHHVEPAVAESVLLAPVAGESVAPMMMASRLRTVRERPARASQAITHVVVAAVADRFVEQSCIDERLLPERRISRADVIGASAANRGIPLLEVKTHDARKKTRLGRACVVALHRAEARIAPKLAGQAIDPAGQQLHVLIDLADHGIPRCPHAQVDRGRESAPVARQHAKPAFRGTGVQPFRRSVGAAVVDDQNFRPARIALSSRCSRSCAQASPSRSSRGR